MTSRYTMTFLSFNSPEFRPRKLLRHRSPARSRIAEARR